MQAPRNEVICPKSDGKWKIQGLNPGSLSVEATPSTSSPEAVPPGPGRHCSLCTPHSLPPAHSHPRSPCSVLQSALPSLPTDGALSAPRCRGALSLPIPTAAPLPDSLWAKNNCLLVRVITSEPAVLAFLPNHPALLSWQVISP